MNKGCLSIADYTFAEVTEVSVLELRKLEPQVYNINA